MRDAALEVRGLEKHFGKTEVLRDLDLDVPIHSIYGFLGPNGAGKSTTMKIVMGLLRPSDGRASVFGRDVHSDGPAARALVGYLPQHARFHPHRTCRQVLEFVAGLYPGREPRGALGNRIDELLNTVGLADLADRRTVGLSGGEAQRLGLAQALVSQPELLILDEPAAALDPEGRHDVLGIIESLRGRATIFYSTHILDDVQRVSDRVAVISSGRIVADGPISDLLTGDGSTWTIHTRGCSADTRATLAAEPWVTDVDIRPRGDSEIWTVRLAGDEAAERLLHGLLADDGVDIAEFHPSDHTLEDAYLSIVSNDREQRRER
jgi:ABC-2 type transport system ATP-binding protein